MTTVPLSDLTDAQRRRARCLEIACVLLPGAFWKDRARVARWIYNGRWVDDD